MTLPPILVTGGNGTPGRQLVERPQQAGRDVRVLSRHSRVPLFVTGDLDPPGRSWAGQASGATGPAGFVVQPISVRKRPGSLNSPWVSRAARCLT